MARITVEDCLEKEKNRFSLVFLASRRAKDIISGKSPVIDTRGNKAVVSALREIADGKVKFLRNNSMESADVDANEVSLEQIIQETTSASGGE